MPLKILSRACQPPAAGSGICFCSRSYLTDVWVTDRSKNQPPHADKLSLTKVTLLFSKRRPEKRIRIGSSVVIRLPAEAGKRAVFLSPAKTFRSAGHPF